MFVVFLFTYFILDSDTMFLSVSQKLNDCHHHPRKAITIFVLEYWILSSVWAFYIVGSPSSCFVCKSFRIQIHMYLFYVANFCELFSFQSRVKMYLVVFSFSIIHGQTFDFYVWTVFDSTCTFNIALITLSKIRWIINLMSHCGAIIRAFQACIIDGSKILIYQV